MPALALTPAGLLTGFAVVVVVTAIVSSALAWRSLRRTRGGRTDRDASPVIDLAYLERAIRADEEATARRAAQARPLLSESPAARPDRAHRLPTNGQDHP